jgi:hypothetical protein
MLELCAALMDVLELILACVDPDHQQGTTSLDGERVAGDDAGEGLER